MLYPQTNRFRTVIDLSGFWYVKTDETDTDWSKGFSSDLLIGVPGSWNEQLAERGLMNYVGTVWYQKSFRIPGDIADRRLLLRLGSADFNAELWLNGTRLGASDACFLPSVFDISDAVRPDEENVLIIRNDNRLYHESIPQGLDESDFEAFDKARELTYPPTVFDFQAYGGLHRPVQLLAVPDTYIENIHLTTTVENGTGIIACQVSTNRDVPDAEIRLTIRDAERRLPVKYLKSEGSTAAGVAEILDCRLWDVGRPEMYELHLQLTGNGEVLDEYRLETGIRRVEWNDRELLLNGKPVFLKGFGKHEDFPVLGKGFSPALTMKDFHLMNWIGANSFRTSHYPYAEEILQIADRLGVLVIDEVPAVSLNFKYINSRTLNNHKSALTRLIQRDSNHPCVIAWSVANEPGIWGEKEATSEAAHEYWKEIRRHTRSLDQSRPITLPTCARLGLEDPAYRYSDVISVNRYWGWYELPGDIKRAGEQLKEEISNIHKIYQKPILVSEFGADTIEGYHATYPQLYTEEYQANLILEYFRIIESLPFTVGEHIWNFADFRTAQNHRRVILNKKGVFTRDRNPKQAAFAVREHWRTVRDDSDCF